jgi:hypothetical protein
MQRFSLVQSLPDSFNLEIYTSRIFDVQGSWFIPLDVDKSNAQGDTLVATPGIKAIVTSGPDHKYTHNITVDKVTISPFGNRITLTEMVKDCRYSVTLLSRMIKAIISTLFPLSFSLEMKIRRLGRLIHLNFWAGIRE